jgi:hypothetical protein
MEYILLDDERTCSREQIHALLAERRLGLSARNFWLGDRLYLRRADLKKIGLKVDTVFRPVGW